MTQSLASRNYVATEADVSVITKQYLGALASQGDARNTYLKALVGTLQAEFQSDLAIARRGAGPEITGPQAKLLKQIHKRFYAIVMATILATPFEDDGRDKNKLRHRRAAFARTSASTLRSWIKAGYDVRTLKPDTVSKRQLQQKVPAARMATGTTPAKRAITLSENIATLAAEIAATDKEAATNTLEAVLTRLTQAMLDLGSRATTKPEVAMQNARPLRMNEGLFWPVITPKNPPVQDEAPMSLNG